MNVAQEYKTFHPKEVAVLIRGELKQNFPGQKFSVKCTTYGSIQVTWRDGVSYNAVQSVTDIFGGRGFDGMTDSTTFSKKMYHGELCQFYTYAPDLTRDLTPDFAQCIADVVATEDHYSEIVVKTNRDGSSYFDGISNDCDNNQASIVRNLSRSIDEGSYSSDEIIIKLRTIEQVYGPMGILDREGLEQKLDNIKRDLDCQPLSHDIDLTQFVDRYSSDAVTAPVTAPVKPTLTIVPDPVPQLPETIVEPITAIEPDDFYKNRIKKQYRETVAAHIADGTIENIIGYDKFKNEWYSSQYKQWVLAAIERGDEESILAIDDWILEILPVIYGVI